MEESPTIIIPMAAERDYNITRTIKAVRNQLLGFIKQRVERAEDAEDILQDVFYQLAGSTEPIGHITGWLYTVARNKITDNYRKQKLPLAEDILHGGQADDDFTDWKAFLSAADSNPETTYLRNLFWEELKSALDELPAEQRDVFIQHELEDISFKDIEMRTGINIATLISRKRYAVLHLRNRLSVLKDELLNF